MQRALGGRDVAAVAISPGEVGDNQRLRDHLGLQLPILSDPAWATYRVFGFRRSARLVLLSPPTWLYYARALAGGRLPHRPTQDVFELGGDVLVDRAGRVAWLYRSRSPVDRPSVEEIVRRATDL